LYVFKYKNETNLVSSLKKETQIEIMLKSNTILLILSTLSFVIGSHFVQAQNTFYIEASSTYVLATSLTPKPIGGDTIKIKADRVKTLQFKGFEGNEDNPIVFINEGGQVHINTIEWGAMRFVDCKFIKVTGTGDQNFRYGFKLQGRTSGLSFEQNSSDVEAERIEIEGTGTTFFGIYAKKDFIGNPPFPYPIFKNLSIHDNYIHDLAEGMYIGETVAPGMEFKHVRIFNNVVNNTLRESIQLANSVDDIEIYNNILLNSGIEDLPTQNNSLQLGVNTIGNVYNNVIINSKAYGIILLGNGDINLKNNFVQNTKGIFIDNRYTSIPFSPIQIEENFLSTINNERIIENLNEYNNLFIRNNNYDNDFLFFKNSVVTSGEIVLENNQLLPIENFNYSLENGIFDQAPENPAIYHSMGPIPGLSQSLNFSPILSPIENVLILNNESLTVSLSATVLDGDVLHFESENLPSFMHLMEIESGKANLTITPTIEDVGVYEIGIFAFDESHKSYARQAVRIAIKDPNNQNPVLNFAESFTMEATEKARIPITAFDADGDSIHYSLSSSLSFVHLLYENEQVYLDIQPKLENEGTFQIILTADDYFGSPTNKILNLNVLPTTLFEGRLLYRVNFGGPEIIDTIMNWQADTDREALFGTTHFLRTGSWFFKGENTTSAPNELFGPYRYDGAEGVEMQFALPLPTQGTYHVKLFFAERLTEVESMETGIFSVYLENNKILDNFNILERAGMAALELNFDVDVIDGNLNLDFEQIANKDKINGIEISYKSEVAANLAPEIQAVSFVQLNENTQLSIPIHLLDDASVFCNALQLTALALPSFASLVSLSASDYELRFNPGFQDAGSFTFLFVASDGCLNDTLSVEISVLNINQLPTVESVPNIEIITGETLTIAIQAHDLDLETLAFYSVNLPAFAVLTDNGDGSASLTLSPQTENLGNYIFEIGVEDEQGGLGFINLTIDVFVSPVINRIILNAAMISDLVVGGSYYSPLYLVDEQNLDPLIDAHPKSRSWIPAKKSGAGPYETIIDLGQEYYIENALLHDMLSTGDLHISMGIPNQWTEVAVNTTSQSRIWNNVALGIVSRYLKLSMVNTIYAQINEVALYGYIMSPAKRTAVVLANENREDFLVYPNPVKNVLNINKQSEDQKIVIFNMNGHAMFQTYENQVNVTDWSSGLYLIRIFEGDNMIYQQKFMKID